MQFVSHCFLDYHDPTIGEITPPPPCSGAPRRLIEFSRYIFAAVLQITISHQAMADHNLTISYEKPSCDQKQCLDKCF